MFDFDKCMEANLNENESEAAAETHRETSSMRQEDKRKEKSAHCILHFHLKRKEGIIKLETIISH